MQPKCFQKHKIQAGKIKCYCVIASVASKSPERAAQDFVLPELLMLVDGALHCPLCFTSSLLFLFFSFSFFPLFLFGLLGTYISNPYPVGCVIRSYIISGR